MAETRAGRLIAVEGSVGRDVSEAATALYDSLTERHVNTGVSRWDASGLFTDVVSAPVAQRDVSPRTLLLLYAADVRRDPASPPVRATAAAFDRARGRAAYAGTALRAWIETGGRLVELRLQLTRLRRARQRAIDDLGVAAYRRDTKEVAELRKRLAALDEAIADRERATSAEVERARAEVASSRVPVNATRELSRR